MLIEKPRGTAMETIHILYPDFYETSMHYNNINYETTYYNIFLNAKSRRNVVEH